MEKEKRMPSKRDDDVEKEKLNLKNGNYIKLIINILLINKLLY